MTIWVSSLAKVHGLAERHAPSMIVSLLSPYDAFPSFPDHAPERHLKVAVHDIASDIGDWKAPGRSDAEQLVRFLEAWDLKSPLLVHCWAGISRSSATAFGPSGYDPVGVSLSGSFTSSSIDARATSPRVASASALR